VSMQENTSPQMELGFGASTADGYTRWVQEREAVMAALARQLGLPLGHAVEIWLRDGIRLTGKLTLRKDELFMPDSTHPQIVLMVDNIAFTPAEMESCVRLD
jgi:hypothetical protein